MTSGQERRKHVQERRKHVRSGQTVGYVSHYAQQRVDKRVVEIMSRRDAAMRENPRSEARRFSRRPGTSRG